MNKLSVAPLVLCIICIIICCSCKHSLVESEYTLDSIRILRQDWDDCMTKLSYLDNNGVIIGEGLFYYPGRDGWFLIDNIWDNNGRTIMVLCDACPKIIINDSLRFLIQHDYSNIQVNKSRWIRISSCDDMPVVKNKNKEYGSRVIKKVLKSGKVKKTPDWNLYQGLYYNE